MRSGTTRSRRDTASLVSYMHACSNAPPTSARTIASASWPHPAKCGARVERRSDPLLAEEGGGARAGAPASLGHDAGMPVLQKRRRCRSCPCVDRFRNISVAGRYRLRVPRSARNARRARTRGVVGSVGHPTSNYSWIIETIHECCRNILARKHDSTGTHRQGSA